MTGNIERRGHTIEVRTNGRKLEGYAAIFGAEAKIDGSFVETISPGAFRNSIAGNNDILALVDHDPAKLLARTASGTLRLAEDSRGLAFDLDVPDTQVGKDILALAARGDLGGMSFGFNVLEDKIIGEKRELLSVDLIEISVVQAFPAYEGTVVNARSSVGKFPTPHAVYIERLEQITELYS